MHHRALRLLPSPAPATTYYSTPLTFTQVLQAAAGRAWVRRASSRPTISTGTPVSVLYLPTAPCGRPGPSYKLASEKSTTAKRCLASSTTAQTINLGVKTEVEQEQTPNGVTTAATVCHKDVTQGHPTTAFCSTSKQETSFVRSFSSSGTTTASTQEITSEKCESLHEFHNAQPQDTNTAEASTKSTVTLPPRSTLIPQTSHIAALPQPTTQQMLYDNLRLSLSMQPLPNLPALIDYHDTHSKLRSSKSYNFLIELAIRHAQFGIAHWLFDAMIQDRIPQDSITHKLKIRLLIRTGNWELAWTHASGISAEEALDKRLRNGLPPIHTGIPWDLWLELLFTPKRGAQRPTSNLRWTTDKQENNTRLPIYDPPPSTRPYSRQQQLLACVYPVLSPPTEEVKSYPKLVKGAIYAMLHDGRASAASELTKKCLLALPLELSDRTAAQWMDIIHLLLSAGTGNGLSSLYANRRLLVSLLRTHPSLKPSSATLFLLLAPLKKVKKGGTVASNVTNQFRGLWGPEVVDGRVRRRVGMLARKEGRMDIVQAMVDEEMAQRLQMATAPSPTPQTSLDLKGLRRPVDRELFQRGGKEEARWRAFKARIRREKNVTEATNKTEDG